MCFQSNICGGKLNNNMNAVFVVILFSLHSVIFTSKDFVFNFYWISIDLIINTFAPVSCYLFGIFCIIKENLKFN